MHAYGHTCVHCTAFCYTETCTYFQMLRLVPRTRVEVSLSPIPTWLILEQGGTQLRFKTNAHEIPVVERDGH
jgi:hypothetical protein